MPTLEFKGKPFVYSHHLSAPFRELLVDLKKSLPAKGKKPSFDDNLIIHGDNLEALKALLPRYAGKVDVIYIDPPYNTGTESWIYNDNVNSPLMKEWLGKVVDRDDLERHDKWLCMMWPRLILLRELLSETGGIFVQLDTNESHHTKILLDEIFGEDNFRNELIVGRGIKNVQAQFEDITRLSAGHDTILSIQKMRTGAFRSLMSASVMTNPANGIHFGAEQTDLLFATSYLDRRQSLGNGAGSRRVQRKQ